MNDWAGRCIAESKTAKAAHAITLTYGNGDHPSAQLLTYSDVQKFFRKLRHGRGERYPCKYFSVGEYGARKGRAHWHLIVFWKNAVPPHQTRTTFDQKHWEHGYSFWDDLKDRPGGVGPAVRYVCKYLAKDFFEAERQGHLSMSKKPPLGSEYFEQLAGRYVDQGLAPQSLFYHFPEVVDRTGKPREMMLPKASATADIFCRAFVDQWAARRGGHYPASPLLEEYEDRMAREHMDPRKDRWGRKVHPPEGGVETKIGTDPVTGQGLTLYSDAHGYRWWYRQIDGEFGWRKGERVERPLPKIPMPAGVARYRALSDGA